MYFYCVPKENTELFLSIQKKSSELYKKHGAIDDWTFAPDNLNEKYGCSSFLKEISVLPTEELFFSISLFKNKEEYEQIISTIDADEEIAKLFIEFSNLIDIPRVIRGEFNRLL